MSLRNISLENYSYEMLNMNSSSRLGHPFQIHPSDLKEATEATHSSSSNKVNTKEKKAFGLRMKKDLKDSCQTTMKRRSGSSKRTMDAFIARKVSGRNFKKKNKGKGKAGNKKGNHQRGGLNPSEKAVLAERPIWPTKTMIPTTRHIGEKAKERRERNENSNIPMMETTVIHPMRMAKERADMKKGNPRRSQPPQRRRRSSPPSSRLHHRAYLCRLDRPRLGSIMDMERTWLVLIP